jgi:hypothetical protein
MSWPARLTSAQAAALTIGKGRARYSFGSTNTIGSGGITGHTWQSLFQCPVEFYAVQFLFANPTTTDLTILLNRLSCSAAATEKYSDRVGAWQGGAKTANFTALTFGGNTYPPLTAATGTGNRAYTYGLSDVLPMRAYAPTEGTDYKALVRCLTPGNVSFIDASGSTTAIRQFASDWYSDDVGAADYTASNPASLNGPDDGFITCFGAVFHTAEKYVSGLAVGDSISGGTGTADTVSGYPLYARKSLTASGKKAGMQPSGIASSNSTDYIARAKAIINAGMAPNFCVFPINTRNDPGTNNPTATQVSGRIQAAIAFAEYLADRNIIPVIVGPTPEASLPAAGIAAYTTFESVGPVIAATFGGVYISALTVFGATIANSYAWAVAGDTSDNVHTTDQGASKLGTVVANAVLPYLP